MSKKKSSSLYRLLVVAHPDDETLFFSGALLSEKKYPWHVVCVTNGDADGSGSQRALQFKAACKKLKVKKSIQWSYPDIYENRLDIKSLIAELKKLPEPFEVYTHGIIGEYGHPHHQDVSFAVHHAFAHHLKVWAPAYNCLADKTIKLTEQQYKLKSQIYADIYKGETLRFSNFLPNRNVDEFVKLDLKEINEIYNSIIDKREPALKLLNKYKWYAGFIADKNKSTDKRPF